MDWVEHLTGMLAVRQPHIKKMEDYHAGDHPLAFASSEFREEFGRILEDYSDNWCELIADAPLERLKVTGFRFGVPNGDDPAPEPESNGPGNDDDDAESADMETWRIWRANRLTTGHRQAIRTSLVTGRSYGLAWYPRIEGGLPRVTFEHPSDFVAEWDPQDPSRAVAAWKQWVGLDGHGHAVLITTETVANYRTTSAVYSQTVHRDGAQASVWAGTWQLVTEEENPLRIVPVVELPNRPDLKGRVRSELATVIPNQDAINKLAQDMLIASEYGGFVQKTASGVEIEVDPQTGQPVEAFKPNKSRFLHSEDPGARFASIPHTPLANFVSALDNRVNSIASQTRTPPHYLNASADRLSGESIKAAETGLVAKVYEKHEHLGYPLSLLMRYAHLIRGDRDRYESEDVEVLWSDPESRTEAQHTDAIIKQYQAGLISWQVALEKLDYSPTEIRRMRSQVRRERLEASAFDFGDLEDAV